MRDCHLVAYRQAGFNPVAIASRNPATAREVAAAPRHPDRPRHLSTPCSPTRQVEILDVAVPAGRPAGPDPPGGRDGQGPAPRHPRPEAARPVGERTRRTWSTRCADGRHRAGGQPEHAVRPVGPGARRTCSTRGWLGEPVLATIDMRAIPHWMPWAEGLPSLSTFVMSIHHLDTFRYWLGTPDRVLASTRPDPRTKFPHRDGINLYILEYDARPAGRGLGRRVGRAVQGGGRRRHRHPLAGRGDRRAGPGHDRLAELPGQGAEHARLQHATAAGHAGSARGGTRCGSRTPSSARWRSSSCAVEDGTEPEIGGRDNLETIALCEAVFAAATEHRVTTVREFLG